MSTHPLRNISVFAGLMFTGVVEVPALAGDPQSTPTPVAPAAIRPKVNPPANRPLTAKDVWGHDYTQARQRAKTLNRPVLVHFHATWCGPCQHMEHNVLNSNDVLKEIHSRCVAIKVDSDKHPNLVQQFGVEALPCDVIVSSDGKILKVNQGALSAEQYKALVSSVARPAVAAPAGDNVASN